MKSTCKAGATWHHFWFTPQDPLPLCLMRWAVGAILLYSHAVYSLDLVGFLGDAGWNNAGIVRTLQDNTLSWSVWWWIPGGSEWAFHLVCLGILFCFWIGLGTRITSILAWGVTVSYAHRSMLSNFGLDQIGAMLVFYLMLAPCGARLSVDRLWLRWRKRSQVVPCSATGLATRLIQIHVCVIYFWAGISKLQGEAWWTGNALWQVIANQEYQTFDLTWLANYPTVLQLATHGVLLFELSLPVFLFRRGTRPIAMWIGVAMHLGIGVFLGMGTFGLIMLTSYIAFFDAAALRQIGMRVRFRKSLTALAKGEEGMLGGMPGLAIDSLEPPPEPPFVTASETTTSAPPPYRLAPPQDHVSQDESASPPQFMLVPAATKKVATNGEANPTRDSGQVEQTVRRKRRRRYVTDKLFYVARSKRQRANVRLYFRRHQIACSVLRGAAELTERTVNLRKATIVLRAKDFSLTELQFWLDELVDSNPDGQFRVFLLPNVKSESAVVDVEIPARVHFFRLSATTTLRRIRKLYLHQDWESSIDENREIAIPMSPAVTKSVKHMSWLLILLVAMGCGADRNAPKVKLERARMMLARGQLQESVQMFSAALEKLPGSADDFYDRGVAYEQLKQFDQAVADYTEALRLEPKHGLALNNRAVVLAQLGRVEEALRDLTNAIEINPADALAWGNRGLAQHEVANFEEAIADYSTALELKPDARLRFQRGNVYADDGQFDAAVADYTTALELDETMVSARLNRGNVMVQLGRLDDAVADLQAVSKTDRELSLAGAIQQLERQIRRENWQALALQGLSAWLQSQGYQIEATNDVDSLPFRLNALESGSMVRPCVLTTMGPRGTPILDAEVTQKLVDHDGAVALFVVDKVTLVRKSSENTASQPAWLSDWRLEWTPELSDFTPSQVEVILAPAAE